MAAFGLILAPGKTLIAIGLGALGTALWSGIHTDMVSVAGLLPVWIAGVGMITAGVGMWIATD